MKLLHILHILDCEAVGEEHLDVVDTSYVFSSNYQVINICDDEYLTSGGTSYE